MRTDLKNFACLQFHREIDERYRHLIQNKFIVTYDDVRRLGLYAELEGHSGCVNCLEWNESGTILASGSDDVHVNLWDPFRKKKLVSIPSGHQGNIFSVKFVPNSGDRQIISGAADNAVRVHEVERKEVVSVCSCHTARVKRVATDPNVPHLLWSAGEDGVILQHDLRTPHECSSSRSSKKQKNILIDLKCFTGSKAEAKCLAISPTQPELMAVGANDPYVRLYDRRMLKVSDDSNPLCPPPEAVQYFVPGHLPSKMIEYKRTFRSIASTYVAFSPNGKELLVNLGGEQIYLFPLCPDLQKLPSSFTIPGVKTSVEKEVQKREKSTTNGYVNGYTIKMPRLSEVPFMSPENGKVTPTRTLPDLVEIIKLKANEAFQSKKYSRAIQLYNEALSKFPNSPVLLGNRAAALLKRTWDGDVYVAMRDCCTALALDPGHFKAHLRLCRCLYELGRYEEAEECLRHFEANFPDHAQTQVFHQLENEIASKLKSVEEKKKKAEASDAPTKKASAPEQQASDFLKSAPTDGSSSEQQQQRSTAEESSSSSTSVVSTTASNLRNYFLRLSRASSDSSNSSSASQNENVVDCDDDDDEDDGMTETAGDTTTGGESRGESSSGGGGGDASGETGGSETDASSRAAKRKIKLLCFVQEENKFKAKAVDFSERFCGHCNTTTDIKEANFFGNFIVAGSDDGSFFIWDKETTNIVRILKGDESIVNCLQPHCATSVLATSGIDSSVKIWSPLPDDEQGKEKEREVEDIDDAASSNQKRMASYPGNFLSLFLNMGYRLNAEQEEEGGGGGEEVPDAASVQCNSS